MFYVFSEQTFKLKYLQSPISVQDERNKYNSLIV